jgi:hypothetical protein
MGRVEDRPDHAGAERSKRFAARSLLTRKLVKHEVAKAVERPISLVVILVLILFAAAQADSWAPPEPKGYACNVAYPDSGSVAYVEIFPPGCSQNPTDNAFCYYYMVSGLDCGEEKRTTLRWSGNLVNPVMPHRVFVPRNGQSLVTLDDYSRMGYDNCVVIYAEDGRVLERYSLSDLYSADAIEKIHRTGSSRWWLEDPRSMFSDDGRYFYLRPIGPGVESDEARPPHVFRFDLQTGEMMTLFSPGRDEGTGYGAEGKEFLLRFSSISGMRGDGAEK